MSGPTIFRATMPLRSMKTVSGMSVTPWAAVAVVVTG
jgi:hypothetical protein